MPSRFTSRARLEILLSPVLVIAVSHVTARLSGHLLGVWSWAVLALVFWSTAALICYRHGGVADWRTRLRRSQGRAVWATLALLVGFIPLPIFLLNWKLLLPLELLLPWLLFGLVNPWIEEGYWRGLLLDASEGWPIGLRVAYTAGAFAISHPLMFGVNSVGVRSPEVLISTFVMGAVWAVVYLKTKSLRWCIASHMLVDLLSLSVPVFMNVYVPPGPV